MSSNKKILFLFTDKYPFGYTEQFIVNEVEFLSKSFDQIFAFPMNKTGEKRTHPDNLTAHYLLDDLDFSNKTFLKNSLTILSVSLQEFSKSSNKMLFIKNFKTHIKTLFNAICVVEKLEQFIIEQKIDRSQLVCYSYWFYHWSIVLGILKKKKKISYNVARAHMGDLYDDLMPDRMVPFQYFKIKTIDQLYCVSQHGSNYLKNKFPSLKNKITHAYLGVDQSASNPNADQEIFTIVSCSSLSPRKRIHLIPEILKYLDFKVHWIHFGEGSEQQRIEKAVKQLPQNIKVELKGFTPNDQVKAFYAQHPINLFVNVSEAEGIPVSLMEVASFGIPMLAVKVFGNPEIVNEHTGILIEDQFDPKVVAEKISDFRKRDHQSLRKEIKDFYEKNFNADTNYTNFSKSLLSFINR